MTENQSTFSSYNSTPLTLSMAILSQDELTLVSQAHSISRNKADGRTAGPSTIPGVNKDDGSYMA